MTDAGGHKHALVLSGGGAYGAYEVGVLRALLTEQPMHVQYRNVDPDIYTGTSVGAINTAVMVSQDGVGASSAEAVNFLENVWLDLISGSSETCGNGAYRIRADPFRYLNPRCLTNPAQSLAELTEDGAYLAQDFLRRSFNFFNTPGNLETRALEFVDLSAFVSPEPVNNLVRQIISLESIRRSPKALRFVATNWATGQARTFENKDMDDDDGYRALLGSAAVPGFFPPHYIAGEPYVDGGVVMNTPLKCAIQAGGTILHVIYLDPDISSLPLKILQNTYNTLDRTIIIHIAAIIEEDIITAAWINEGLEAIERVSRGEDLSDENVRDFIRAAGQIEKRIRQGAPYKKLTIHRYHPQNDPGGGGVGILDFRRERIERLIEQGFNDTLQHDCKKSHCILPKD